MRATTLEDNDGGRWIPSATVAGTFDLHDDRGVLILAGWPREDIEAAWPLVREVEEP